MCQSQAISTGMCFFSCSSVYFVCAQRASLCGSVVKAGATKKPLDGVLVSYQKRLEKWASTTNLQLKVDKYNAQMMRFSDRTAAPNKVTSLFGERFAKVDAGVVRETACRNTRSSEGRASLPS